MRQVVSRGLLASALLLSAACAAAPPPETEETAEEAWEEPSSLSPELAAARAALDRYQDPIVAVHDGYLSTLGCVEYPEGGGEGTIQYAPGGMGVHFLNMQYISPTLDPARPQVLIYQPVGDRLRLAAAEWFVPVQAAGAQRPQIFGKELEGPMAGHEPLMPEGLHHYDLHVWLWKNNPAGVFAPTNPAVECPVSNYSFQEAAPKLVSHGH
jgi:hypothetical protein